MGIKMIVPGVYEFYPESGEERDDSERVQSLSKWSGLPEQNKITKRFCNFEELPDRKEALEACFAFIRGEIEPPLLLLVGKPGTSKSHLAIATCWSFISQLKTVRFYEVSDLLDKLREGIRIQRATPAYEHNPDAADVILNGAKNCNLLVLDDMKEAGTDWAADKLDSIVNHRYNEGLPTLITANTFDIPERVLDRMQEGRIVRIKGRSYREIIAARKVRDGKVRDTVPAPS